MHQASVGVHCPECTSKNKQKIYTRRNLPGSRGLVTQLLVGLSVVVYLLQFVLFGASLGTPGTAANELATFGPAIDANQEWWRIITGGFGHFDIFHLGLNMFGIFRLGQILEGRLGPVRFTLAYFAALVGGSFGALLAEPLALTMGASGALFGLLGLTVMLHRARGIDIAQSGLGPVLLVAVFISLRGHVSLGGHAGGFIVGIALGVLYFGTGAPAQPPFGRDQVKPDIATAVAFVVLFLGCLWAASRWIAAAS